MSPDLAGLFVSSVWHAASVYHVMVMVPDVRVVTGVDDACTVTLLTVTETVAPATVIGLAVRALLTWVAS